jgi:Zn-dependent peptidase ImmA (M78 family)
MSRRVERHADRFAAAVLMPIPLFERELVRALEGAQVEPSSGLSELMMPTSESERLWVALVVPELCRRFAVSRIAAVIRCRGLRLISDNRRALMPMRFFERFMEMQNRPAGGIRGPESPAT